LNAASPALVSQPPQFERPRQGAGHAPLRRAGSVRRTTSIDCLWPDGFMEAWELTGRARDAVTPLDGGAPHSFAEGGFTITATLMREIAKIATTPEHPQAQALVGVRAGGQSREALARAMGDLRGQPLFQLIDDFAGASLVSRWVFSQWQPDWMERITASADMAAMGQKGPRAGVCSGFAPGSTALDGDRPKVANDHRTEVVALENPADPQGWHAMPPMVGTEGEGNPQGEPRFRRARRIDVWRDGDLVWVDAGFQDSGNTPDGQRAAIHEYRVYAQVDATTMELRSLQALPLILPFAECPVATIKASKMIGQPVTGFRSAVIETLPGIEGCTHLNDVLRALSDVPELAAHLPG
jgi:hypothetical protein